MDQSNPLGLMMVVIHERPENRALHFALVPGNKSFGDVTYGTMQIMKAL